MFPLNNIVLFTGLVDEYTRFKYELESSGMQQVIPLMRAANGSPPKAYQTKLVSDHPTYTLHGSPYNSRVTMTSSYTKIWQHCFPTLQLFNWHKTDDLALSYFERSEVISYPSYPSITRNGLTSTAYGVAYNGHLVTKFVYWDPFINRVMVYNPSIAETPYFYYS